VSLGFGMPWVRVSPWVAHYPHAMLNQLTLPSSHRTGGFPASGVPSTFAAGLRRELTYTLSGINRPRSARTRVREVLDAPALPSTNKETQ
jgi:hypothetical protein